MKKTDTYKIIVSIIAALALTLIIDTVLTYFVHSLSVLVFVIIFALLSAGYVYISKKKSITFMLVNLAVLLAVIIVPVSCWKYFKNNSSCVDLDDTKGRIFANQKVMFIVPHEEDELSIGSGLFEQYIKYGSEVYLVVFINEDQDVNGTINAMGKVGIDKNHLIFLGYSPEILKEIYLSEDEDKIFTDKDGRNSKLVSDTCKIFNEEGKFTRKNVISDLEDIFNEYKPDTVFVSDYDADPDHQAVSLFFDETIGKMSKEKNANVPSYIYKTFTYLQSYLGVDDFYNSINITATKKSRPEPYNIETNVFTWKKRIRFPVNADTLSRSIYNSDVYEEASMYDSDEVLNHAGKIISGDKVFWYRQTNNVLYTADITSSSPGAEVLNDFKLYDSNEYFEKNKLPEGGLWVAKENDREKKIRVVLDSEQDLSLIRLYDNPSTTSNILEATIVFDNGHLYYTGPLTQNGDYTKVLVNETGVKSFEITIISSEGSKPGLTEIEAYNYITDTYHKSDFIKVVNGDGNFIYDYIVGLKGEEKFSLYTPVGYIDVEDYDINFNGERYTGEINNGYITIKCFTSGYCIINVSDGYNSDTVRVSNPTMAYRIGWNIDKLQYESDNVFDKTMLHRIFNLI